MPMGRLAPLILERVPTSPYLGRDRASRGRARTRASLDPPPPISVDTSSSVPTGLRGVPLRDLCNSQLGARLKAPESVEPACPVWGFEQCVVSIHPSPLSVYATISRPDVFGASYLRPLIAQQISSRIKSGRLRGCIPSETSYIFQLRYEVGRFIRLTVSFMEFVVQCVDEIFGCSDWYKHFPCLCLLMARVCAAPTVPVLPLLPRLARFR